MVVEQNRKLHSPVSSEQDRQHVAGPVARALVVEAVARRQARPLRLAAAAHQRGHAMPVQRPRLAEVHKVEHHLLACRHSMLLEVRSDPPPPGWVPRVKKHEQRLEWNNCRDQGVVICISLYSGQPRLR